MALNGFEIMLKSMGLGETIGEIKRLAESGAIQKIMMFADEIERIRLSVDRIERHLERLENERSTQPRTDPPDRDGPAFEPLRLLGGTRAD